eukprot:COSAG06_NODE_855_length_11931_cov_20.218813_16_plen_119_part_00
MIGSCLVLSCLVLSCLAEVIHDRLLPNQAPDLISFSTICPSRIAPEPTTGRGGLLTINVLLSVVFPFSSLSLLCACLCMCVCVCVCVCVQRVAAVGVEEASARGEPTDRHLQLTCEMI